MSFLSLRPRSSRRAKITCARCGVRITLADQIHKDGDGFVHERCPSGTGPGRIPAQRS